MSDIEAGSAKFSPVVEQLRGAMIAAAVICVLAFAAAWLVDRPAKAVRAEAVATLRPTSVTTPRASRAAQTPSPSPTTTMEPTPLPTTTPAATSTPDDQEPAPTTAPPSHAVRRGETLAGIARSHDISVDELLVLNELANPDLLYVGQEIILPPSATAPGAPEPSPTTSLPSMSLPDEIIAGRWIDVDISEQRLTAYEASSPVRTTLVSTGLPQTPTPVGQYRIWIKLRFDDMAGADYYIEDVPHVMYFHEGYGLHGVTWHGNFGYPMSHGCVNLPTTEAEWLYDWAEVGTLVSIHQ